MTARTVTTQADLNAALADTAVSEILINSPRGVWLVVGSNGASGSTTVKASGWTTVEAYDSVTVRASGSATVRAYDSATVRAYDSVTVQAYDSATVRAYSSATVEAYSSATVRASGSATVQAYDSATVQAYDSATVQAYGSATVQAYDLATVRASKYVAIHLHGARATVTGGVLIDLTTLDRNDPRTWCEMSGVDINTDDTVTLYKAVDDNFQAGHSYTVTTYAPGTTVTAVDWRDDHTCGGGLHFGATPHLAEANAINLVSRYVAVRVPLAVVRPIGDKAKAPQCVVLQEVDAFARPVTAVTA